MLVKKLPRKVYWELCESPVPQTDTGIRDEYSKARELNLSKELGKLIPYLWYKGCPRKGVADKSVNRLFSKNTALC